MTSLRTRHEWAEAPFDIVGDAHLGDSLPRTVLDEISRGLDPALVARFHAGQGGPYSMGTVTGRHSAGARVRAAAKAVSFATLYGGGKDLKAKRWQCARCRKVYYAESLPPAEFLEEVRIPSEDGLRFEMPLVPCRLSHMPVFRMHAFGTCDEEMVRWVMES